MTSSPEAAKKRGLGRGLDALLPAMRPAGAGADKNVFTCAIEKIVPRKGQPRTHFDPLALDELARSIKEHGLIEPLVVRRAWRGMAFDQSTQEAMLARFFDVLTLADHIAREDFLLYGVQGPAAQDMLRLIPADQQALDAARMAGMRGLAEPEEVAAVFALLASPEAKSITGAVYTIDNGLTVS